MQQVIDLTREPEWVLFLGRRITFFKPFEPTGTAFWFDKSSLPPFQAEHLLSTVMALPQCDYYWEFALEYLTRASNPANPRNEAFGTDAQLKARVHPSITAFPLNQLGRWKKEVLHQTEWLLFPCSRVCFFLMKD